MLTRTTRETVHFHAPFLLQGVEGQQPAGDYEIDADEDLLEGLATVAYIRRATFINLPAIAATDRRIEQHVPIAREDLEAALHKDSLAHAAREGK